MNLQFLHDRPRSLDDGRVTANGGMTHALEVDTEFLNSISVGDVISLGCGISICSDKDCYNKKTGRELAVSRVTGVPFTVVAVYKLLREKNSELDIITDIRISNDKLSYILTQDGVSKKFRLVQGSFSP